MVRIFLLALIAACASPALAQSLRCDITREANGLTTVGSLDVHRLGADNLKLETGPFVAKLKIEAKAKAKGYSAGKSKLAFQTFQYGETLPGADWRTAGSMTTENGGFRLEWPRLLLSGKPVKDLTIQITVEAMTAAWPYSQEKNPDRKGVAFAWIHSTRDMRFSDLQYGEDEDDALDYWSDWEPELAKHKPIYVTFTDKATNQKIGTATLVPLDAAAAQARLVADVNALRKEFTEKRCKAY